MEFWGHFPLSASCVEVEAVAWKWRVDALGDVGKGIR